jgi:hypothetical protein
MALFKVKQIIFSISLLTNKHKNKNQNKVYGFIVGKVIGIRDKFIISFGKRERKG